MKILHTSDWHLGRSMGEVSLLSDQADFLEWLGGVVRERSVELVIVAGDLFDRAVAPKEAIRLFRDGIKQFTDAGVQVAAISGNHDGADRVANYGNLLDQSGIYIRGGYDAIGEAIRVDGSDGPLDLILLPYLDPKAAPDIIGLEAPPVDQNDAIARRRDRSHETVLTEAIKSALGARTSPRTIAVSHAFIRGGKIGDSERSLAIGGAELVDARLFEPFSYAALGHLHRPQIVGGDEKIRYSGTPLAYSFSEQHEKSVTLIEMAPDGTLVAVDPIQITVGRGVMTIEGLFEDLMALAPTEAERNKFVRALITDAAAVVNSRSRLLDKFPHLIEVEQRALFPVKRPDNGGPAPEQRRDPRKLAADFWEVATGTPAGQKEIQLLNDALTKAH